MRARAIFWLAATVAVLGAMVTGVPGGLVWAVALLAALIMVRRSWPKPDSASAGSAGPAAGDVDDQNETGT